ncbi:hypothetical protein BGY98DRAFT_924847 [Russula aff. rugulosa BPL654]|nr:hypothetical protein BGY98DRAFT_924847 [Russula aff. rugulosa BPL654]
MSDFPAFPGAYKALFLYIEPASFILPGAAAWFHHGLIPDPRESFASVDARARMIWQLINCYILLMSSLVFRAVREALPGNPAAQERILGACLLAMAIADIIPHVLNSVVSIGASFIGLPDSLRYHPELWNSATHGSISFVIVLLLFRVAWFLGIGRTRYYFGQGSRPSIGRAKYN